MSTYQLSLTVWDAIVTLQFPLCYSSHFCADSVLWYHDEPEITYSNEHINTSHFDLAYELVLKKARENSTFSWTEEKKMIKINSSVMKSDKKKLQVIIFQSEWYDEGQSGKVINKMLKAKSPKDDDQWFQHYKKTKHTRHPGSYELLVWITVLSPSDI